MVLGVQGNDVGPHEDRLVHVFQSLELVVEVVAVVAQTANLFGHLVELFFHLLIVLLQLVALPLALHLVWRFPARCQLFLEVQDPLSELDSLDFLLDFGLHDVAFILKPAPVASVQVFGVDGVIELQVFLPDVASDLL